jgi:predicted amidohydrolase
MILGPKGEIIAEGKQNEESIISGEISLNELSDFRKKFPVLDDGDGFTLNI